MFVFIFVVEYLFVALWSAVCRPKYVAGCASASRWGWHSFLVALWLAICRPKYFAGRASGGCRGGGDGIPFVCPVVGGLPPEIFCWSRFRGGLLSIVVCPVVGDLSP